MWKRALSAINISMSPSNTRIFPEVLREPSMSLEKIKAAIPHREPFLLIDEIVEQDDSRIVCRKQFAGDEFWYAGHYPNHPLTPGVLLCEAAMQAGAVLLSGLWKTIRPITRAKCLSLRG